MITEQSIINAMKKVGFKQSYCYHKDRIQIECQGFTEDDKGCLDIGYWKYENTFYGSAELNHKEVFSFEDVPAKDMEKTFKKAFELVNKKSKTKVNATYLYNGKVITADVENDNRISRSLANRNAKIEQEIRKFGFIVVERFGANRDDGLIAKLEITNSTLLANDVDTKLYVRIERQENDYGKDKDFSIEFSNNYNRLKETDEYSFYAKSEKSLINIIIEKAAHWHKYIDNMTEALKHKDKLKLLY